MKETLSQKLDRLDKAGTEAPWILHNDAYGIDRIETRNHASVIDAETADVDGTGFQMPYATFADWDAELIVTLRNAWAAGELAVKGTPE